MTFNNFRAKNRAGNRKIAIISSKTEIKALTDKTDKALVALGYNLAQFVRKAPDNAIQRLNHYPVDSVVYFILLTR